MKRCPECRRDYYDDSLLYCLDDGSTLLDGPASDGPATVILPKPGSAAAGFPASESQTKPQIHITESEAEPRKSLGESLEKHSFSANRAAKPLVVLAAAVVILVGGFFGYRYFGSAASAQINSIAVLPFENRSGNTDADYLSDGLTDSLIFRFSQLPNLKVSPTSSVMRYKGKNADVAEIANELEVDAVLSGRLIQLGDSLNINVQLIDARTKKLIWAEQYDRKMADLLETQREIATTLTQKMKLRLAGDETGITKKYTSSNEAYQLYLKGRYQWSRRTKDDLLNAIGNYRQAIELDPSFALAYAAIAEAYNSMGKNPDAAPKECIPFAKAAAIRALEIDPTLAQAHSALGDSLAIYDWNWTESERHFNKAFELDSNISYIHVVYGGSYLNAMGKGDEAEAELERAVEMEPLSLINNAVLVSAYINARHYDKAVVQARKAYELDSSFPLTHHWLGMAYVATGQQEAAVAVSREVAPDSPSGWMSVVVLAHAYAKMDKKKESEEQISVLRNLAKTRYIRSYYIASIYATLGDKDNAFAELERSFEERDCYLGRAAVDPFMDPLRDDPRFKDLMKRMKLSD